MHKEYTPLSPIDLTFALTTCLRLSTKNEPNFFINYFHSFMLLSLENDGNQLNQVRKRNFSLSDVFRPLDASIPLRIHLFTCSNRQPRTIMHENPALTNRDWIWQAKALNSSETFLFKFPFSSFFSVYLDIFSRLK